jgi:hypothetical protein
MRTLQVIRTLLISSGLLLALAACTQDVPQPTEPPQQESEPTPAQPTPQVSGPCVNPFFPVISGATWSYKSSGGAAGDYSFTDTITAVSEEGFTLNSQFEQLTRIIEWSCQPDGLAALQLGSGPAAGISTDQFELDITPKSTSGVILPPTIAPGDRWTYSLEFEGAAEMAGNPATATGRASYAFEALAVESVSVPAGTFDAMKVKADLTMDVQISVQSVSTPVSFTFSSFMWWAPGVGWVKSENTGDLGTGPFTETIELQSYTIP